MRKVEVPQLWVGLEPLVQISNGGHAAMHQRLNGNDVFDTHAHRMSSIAFGVGNHNLIGFIAKGLAQGMDLCCSTATARRRIRLMGHEHHFPSQIIALEVEALLSFD